MILAEKRYNVYSSLYKFLLNILFFDKILTRSGIRDSVIQTSQNQITEYCGYAKFIGLFSRKQVRYDFAGFFYFRPGSCKCLNFVIGFLTPERGLFY
jgi:hypothetical protein